MSCFVVSATQCSPVAKSDRVRKPTAEAKRSLRLMLLCGRPWVECHWCGVRLTESQITVDHILPRSHGGTNAISNIVPACLGCNAKRGNRTYAKQRRIVEHA